MTGRDPSDRLFECVKNLVARLSPAPAAEAPPEGIGVEQMIACLRALEEEVLASRAAAVHGARRLDDLMQMFSALVSFDYSKRAELSPEDDIYDGFATCLNTLAEELASSTVSKAYVDNIIESMSDPLLVIDASAQIRTVNQAACDLTGRRRAELVDQSVEALFEGFSVGEVLSSGGVRGQERACTVEGGAAVQVSLSAAVMRSKRGVTEGLVCVARDLTESRRIEEERFRLRDAVQRQSIILEELSMPLIPITDEILVMPLIGTVDEHRSAQIIEALLQGVVSRRARVAIIDITGIHRIEGAGVVGILRAVQAVRLVGAEVALTGVRPEVAQLLVAEGHDLSAVKTFGSLQNGVVHAMKSMPSAARR